MNPSPLRLSLASLLLTKFALAGAPSADGWLGVFLANDREQAVVVEVIPDSPAARAGLQAGDELIAVDGTATPTREALIEAIRGRKAGSKLKLKLRRGDVEKTVTVELAERPTEMPTPGAGQAPPAPPKRVAPPAPVVEVQPADGRRAYLGLRVRESGDAVVVDEALADGPAASLGIRPGERITQFGDRLVRTLADLDAVLRQQAPGSTVALGLRSEAGSRSVLVTLGELPGRGAQQPAPPRDVAEPRPTPGYDVEREIAELRRDLQDLRRQLEELRRQRGR